MTNDGNITKRLKAYSAISYVINNLYSLYIIVTRAGTEPTSLALECRFLITGPAGESLYFHCAMDPHVEQLVLGLI